MSGRMEVWSIYHIVGSSEDRLCMCEDEDTAAQVVKALRAHDVNGEYEVRHDEIVANVDLEVKEW